MRGDIVHAAIHLDDEPQGRADEVDDVRPDEDSAVEADSKLDGSELLPEEGFGLG